VRSRAPPRIVKPEPNLELQKHNHDKGKRLSIFALHPEPMPNEELVP
jgi:hypothetical protein